LSSTLLNYCVENLSLTYVSDKFPPCSWENWNSIWWI